MGLEIVIFATWSINNQLRWCYKLYFTVQITERKYYFSSQ
jgi:hypothetical protein